MLDELKTLLSASTNSEVVRRCLAQHYLLLKALQDAKSVTIPGHNPKGREVRVHLT